MADAFDPSMFNMMNSFLSLDMITSLSSPDPEEQLVYITNYIFRPL